MNTRQETDSQRAARFAAMLRNSQQAQAQGYTVGDSDRKSWLKAEELLSVPFEITDIQLNQPNSNYPDQLQHVLHLLLIDGTEYLMRVPASMKAQAETLSPDEWQDVLYTVVQEGTYRAKSGSIYPRFLLDWASPEMLQNGMPQENNTPQANRNRVLQSRNMPQAQRQTSRAGFQRAQAERKQNGFVPEYAPFEESEDSDYEESNDSTNVDQPVKRGPGRPKQNVPAPAPQKVKGLPFTQKAQASKQAAKVSIEIIGRSLGNTRINGGMGKFPRKPGRPKFGAVAYNVDTGHYVDANGNAL